MLYERINKCFRVMAKKDKLTYKNGEEIKVGDYISYSSYGGETNTIVRHVDHKKGYITIDFLEGCIDILLEDVIGKVAPEEEIINTDSDIKPKGIKNDFKDDKLRWDLLPLEEIEDIVKVYHQGAKKYADNSWQNLENGYQRYKAAMFRHLIEYEKGNDIDEETGCRHLAQVAWNAIAMLYFSKHKEDKK